MWDKFVKDGSEICFVTNISDESVFSKAVTYMERNGHRCCGRIGYISCTDGRCMEVTPFVKWAGSKRRMVNVLGKYAPKKVDVYYEPFLGSGSFFMYMLKRGIKTAYVGDLNKELMIAYREIKNDVDAVIVSLRKYVSDYWITPKQSYAKLKENLPYLAADRAARLIFLSKTSWRGLYRENKSGVYNVPHGVGVKSHRGIMSERNLRTWANLLKSTDTVLDCFDFDYAVRTAGAGDFVYLDPPYHREDGFTDYTQDGWNGEEMDRVLRCAKALHDRGCKVMLSHADVPDVRRGLREWNLVEVNPKLCIGGRQGWNNGQSELIMRNYE